MKIHTSGHDFSPGSPAPGADPLEGGEGGSAAGRALPHPATAKKSGYRRTQGSKSVPNTLQTKF